VSCRHSGRRRAQTLLKQSLGLSGFCGRQGADMREPEDRASYWRRVTGRTVRREGPGRSWSIDFAALSESLRWLPDDQLCGPRPAPATHAEACRSTGRRATPATHGAGCTAGAQRGRRPTRVGRTFGKRQATVPRLRAQLALSRGFAPPASLREGKNRGGHTDNRVALRHEPDSE
jgi:hypothetical protein